MLKKLAASAAIAGALAGGAVMTAGTASADTTTESARIVCEVLDRYPTIGTIDQIRNEMYKQGKGSRFGPIFDRVHSVCPRHHDLIIAWSYDGWV